MNGLINYAPDDVADYDIGTVASYQCNPGFILVGVTARDCVEAADSTGVFEGEAPICERKEFEIDEINGCYIYNQAMRNTSYFRILYMLSRKSF